MKFLIMCEGSNELAIMKILLENDCLKFNIDDLLDLRPFHARQIFKSTVIKAALSIYTEKVTILRIGDALNEKLKISSEYKNRIVEIKKYCTKPELEMLIIISENLVSEYDKKKSKIKPKDFTKENVIYERRRYDNSTEFYKNYFSDYLKLVNSIKEYKRIKSSHNKDELYLADLLK